MKPSRIALLLLATIAPIALVAAEGDGQGVGYWPNWRGPLHSGVAPQGNPPVEWSETKNVRWKVELPGSGHATPVVWGDRIYVSSAVRTEKTEASLSEGRQPGPGSRQPGDSGGPPRSPTSSRVYQFVVSAHDRASGKALWKTVVLEEVPREGGHETGSQASASPITDGQHVWAFFGSRGLYCLDRDGKIVWQHDFGEMQTRNGFGEGASPAIHGDTIVVNWDHEGESFIFALDKATGKQLWKAPRDEATSWSTPLVIQDGDRAIVVVSATSRVRAYDLKNGEEIWSAAGLGVNCIPTPVEHGGLLFVMSGYREAAGMAIRYSGAKGDITRSDRIVWRIERGTSYVSSPVLSDGRLYFLDRLSAVVSCYDLGSGAVIYKEQRLEGVGNVYASPVAANGRIYLLGRNGTAAVFRQGETFELLAKNKLDDAFDASPVIAGDALYLRGHKYLYSIAVDE